MATSFSHRLKAEILENKALRARCRKAQAYGLFLYGRSFRREEVSLNTESGETARLFEDFARRLLGRETEVRVEERVLSAKRVYFCSLPRGEDRRRMLALFGEAPQLNREMLDTPDKIQAFLGGVYLACGNMTDPSKSYHLEFVVRDEALCGELLELLRENIPGARKSRRRSSFVAYYKEFGQIEDLMILMGATKSCLAVIDVEMYKGVRNQANRATNCETANIDKQVGAAAAQAADIRLVLDRMGEAALSGQLLEAAKLRLDNPDMSLRELCDISPAPISRSGLHHRMGRIAKMAAELREQEKEKQ